MDESSPIRPENPHKHIRGPRGKYRPRVKYYTKIEKRFARIYNIPLEIASNVLVDIYYYSKIMGGGTRAVTTQQQRDYLQLKYMKYGLKLSPDSFRRWADKILKWRDNDYDLRKKQGGIY